MKNFWLQPRTIAAYAVSLLALAEIVDLTIVAVAIPDIMGSLSANLSEVSLTMTSYIVAAAVCIPLTGLVTRKFGMRNVVLVSALLFGISSILCGASSSLEEMIAFRILQGIGGAFLPSIAQSYIAQKFTPQEQPKIMTVYSLCVVMGPIIGPLFGGALSEHLSWRWCFYVNVPICIAGFALVWGFMKNDKTENVKIDYISFVFMALGVAALEYFIDEGNSNNWFDSFEMIIVLVSAVILLTFFVWRGLLGKSVINLQIFKNANFVLSCFTMLIFILMVSASMAYFPTMLQQSFGYPVDTAGYITAPRGLVAFIVAPIVAKLVTKVDPRRVIVVGLIIFSISSFMLSGFAPSVTESDILIVALVQGVGMMCFFIPIMQIVFIGIPTELHGDASGVFNFFRNIGSSIGTSVSSTLISHQMQVTWHDMGSHVSPYARGFQWWSQHLAAAPEQTQVGIARLNIMAQGSLISYLDSFYCFGAALLLMIWIPFVLKRPQPGAKIHFD
jgi:DHA2 family multidrug resistance protein